MKRKLLVIVAVVAIAVAALVWQSRQVVDNPRGHIIITTADWHSAAELLTPKP